jgi:hypothetical protein
LEFKDFAPTITYVEGECNVVVDTLSHNPFSFDEMCVVAGLAYNPSHANVEANTVECLLQEELYDMGAWRQA